MMVVGLIERSLKKLFHSETPDCFLAPVRFLRENCLSLPRKRKAKQTAVRNLGVKLEMRVDFWGPPLNMQMGSFPFRLCSVQCSHLQLCTASLGEGAEKVLREECVFCASAGLAVECRGNTQTTVQDLEIKMHHQRIFQLSYCFQGFPHTHFQSYIVLSIPAPCTFPQYTLHSFVDFLSSSLGLSLVDCYLYHKSFALYLPNCVTVASFTHVLVNLFIHKSPLSFICT